MKALTNLSGDSPARAIPAEDGATQRPSALACPVLLWQQGPWLAVHKPSGWLVHRSELDPQERRILLQFVRDQVGQHVYAVHRLDKGTSGVMLLALSPQAASRAGSLFEAGAVNKVYVAMVRGWAPHQVCVDHPLKRLDDPSGAPARPALTRLSRLAELALDVPVDRYSQTRVSLVAALPMSGRRHQIRRHLKHLSHPIIGDATYGKGAHNRWWAEQLGGQRLWLHALALTLTCPFEGRALHLQSSLTDARLNADWQAPLGLHWSWPAHFAQLTHLPARHAGLHAAQAWAIAGCDWDWAATPAPLA